MAMPPQAPPAGPQGAPQAPGQGGDDNPAQKFLLALTNASDLIAQAKDIASSMNPDAAKLFDQANQALQQGVSMLTGGGQEQQGPQPGGQGMGSPEAGGSGAAPASMMNR